MRALTTSHRLPPFFEEGCDTPPIRSQRYGFQVLTPQPRIPFFSLARTSFRPDVSHNKQNQGRHIYKEKRSSQESNMKPFPHSAQRRRLGAYTCRTHALRESSGGGGAPHAGQRSVHRGAQDVQGRWRRHRRPHEERARQLAAAPLCHKSQGPQHQGGSYPGACDGLFEAVKGHADSFCPISSLAGRCICP